MKYLAALILSLAVLSCKSSSDSVEWVDYGADPMQNPQYMEDATVAGTPGPQHAVLAGRAGAWKVEGKMWMAPGAEPMPMQATATTEVLLGGRYVVEEFKSDLMGMPFEGRLVQGFDNLSGEYWCLWTDSMSTGYFLSHGSETSPGTVEFRGTVNDLLTPKGRESRMTTSIHDDGSYTMKMYDTRQGMAEFQTMELHYTR